jgi:hypothetical protein
MINAEPMMAELLHHCKFDKHAPPLLLAAHVVYNTAPYGNRVK